MLQRNVLVELKFLSCSGVAICKALGRIVYLLSEELASFFYFIPLFYLRITDSARWFADKSFCKIQRPNNSIISAEPKNFIEALTCQSFLNFYYNDRQAMLLKQFPVSSFFSPPFFFVIFLIVFPFKPQLVEESPLLTMFKPKRYA